MANECACCQPPWAFTRLIPNFTSCSLCSSGMASCWEFTVAGITSGTCSTALCEAHTGTFTLVRGICTINIKDADCCFDTSEYTGADGIADCSETCYWKMAWEEFGFLADYVTLRLYAFQSPNDRSIKNYRIVDTSFDCNGANVFSSFAGNDSGCNDFPSSITVEPISCP